MDVVNLREGYEVPCQSSIVTDDILEMTRTRSESATIYVVFREPVTLRDPFKLIRTKKDAEITRYSGVTTRNMLSSMRLWNENNGPALQKKANDVIRLKFYKKNDVLLSTWSERLGKYSKGRQFTNVFSNPSMGMYLLLSVDATKVLVLSEQSYAFYLVSRGIFKRNPIACLICYEASEYSFTMFKCCHCLCESCYSNHKSQQCPICRIETLTPEMTRLKLRQGPCPIDMCTEPNKERRGVVIIPCGCHVNCYNLEKKVMENRNNLSPLVRQLPRCPYDVCKQKVTGFQIPLFYDFLYDN